MDSDQIRKWSVVVTGSTRVTRFDLFSRDPEVYDSWMRDAYVEFERRRWGDQQGCSYHFTGAGTAEFSIATSAHGMGIEFTTEPLDDGIIVNANRTGSLAVTGGRTTVDPEVDRLFLMPPGRPWLIRGEGFTSNPVHITDALLTSAASSLGWQDSDLRFDGYLPLPNRHNYLRSTIAHVRDNVLHTFDRIPSLVAAEAARSLAMAALLTFPNNVLESLTDPAAPPVGHGEPATVRRAVEFIDEHAREDIDIAGIAEAARIGARGLQAAFRKHRGQTPMEYLRRVRMEGAHRDLQAADPTAGDTVNAIASRWGFSHPGRFSVEYRRIYRCSPSDTLRS